MYCGMDVPKIKDREHLEAWLKTRSREECVAIAHRAAMRVAPAGLVRLTFTDEILDCKLAVTSFFRPLLVSGVAATLPTLLIRRAAFDLAIYATNYNVDSSAMYSVDAVVADLGDIAVCTYAAGAHAFEFLPASWDTVWRDALAITAGKDLIKLPLWFETSQLFDVEWRRVRTQLRQAPDWNFWVRWYEAALRGEPLNWKMQEEIALLPSEVWEGDVAGLAAAIAGIEKSYDSSALANAFIMEFRFDAVLQHMDMVGFDEDVAHLRDPKAIESFLDDMIEAKDGFQDFFDFAGSSPSRLTNSRSDIAIATEKLLDELKRTKDKTHLRARRLITLANYLFWFSLEEDKRDELGVTLTVMLDKNLELLRGVCRKHLAPSLMRLAPLNDLDIGDNDPNDMLQKIDAAIARIKTLPADQLAKLSPEASAVLADMRQELESLGIAINAATTPEHRTNLKGRFTTSFGAMSATLGRYVEKARMQGDKPMKWLDGLIKNYKRWEFLNNIIDWLSSLGGPPTP